MTARLSTPNRSHRGDAVVSAVVDATREELARVGYRALRFEEVAARANVNRTTIYRRWPTKVDLVRETLRMMFGVPSDPPATGSLRGDLVAIAGHMRAFLTTANGQVLVRMVMAEGAEPELRSIVDELLGEKDARIGELIALAKARGEICQNISCDVLLASLLGGLVHRLFARSEDAASINLEAHIDLLLYGAAVRPAIPPAPESGGK